MYRFETISASHPSSLLWPRWSFVYEISHPNNINFLQLDHVTSAVVLGLSLAGRWYAPKIGVTRIPFTASVMCKGPSQSIILMTWIHLYSGTHILLHELELEREEVHVYGLSQENIRIELRVLSSHKKSMEQGSRYQKWRNQ